MRFYSSALCVLIFLISVSTVVSGTNHTEVKVKLDNSTTLPCHDNCSGSVSWSHSSSGLVAQCDRTSCSAVKEGYEMSRDQYLKGNLSLFIPVADSSKVGVYRCQCDSTPINNVVLHAEYPTDVKVKLYDPATLPGYYRCPGLVTWFHSSSGAVAQCNRTSCSAVNEGYEMSHDQYLKGNLSLFIPVADSSKVGVYICQCDRTPVESLVLCVKSNPVKAGLHGNATLRCSANCSGVVMWTRRKYTNTILALCDQTSCRSLKEGYQMSYDQYLKGDFSLTITDAVYSMWDNYTCQCNGAGLLDVEFGINAPSTSVQIKPRGSLVLDVDVSDPVEVVYNHTGADGSPSGQICSLKCKPEYTERAALQLRGMNLSDSGVYIIRDSGTKEVVHVYTVSVRDVPEEEKFTFSVWELVGVVLGAFVGGVLITVVSSAICKKRRSACGHSLEINCVTGNRGNIQNPEQQTILPPAPE